MRDSETFKCVRTPTDNSEWYISRPWSDLWTGLEFLEAPVLEYSNKHSTSMILNYASMVNSRLPDLFRNLLLRWRKKTQTTEEHIFEHSILTFLFFQENFYYQVTQTWLYDIKWSIWILLKVQHAYMRWEHYTSIKNLWDNIWADPLSYRDSDE